MEVINGKGRLGLGGALILKIVHRVCLGATSLVSVRCLWCFVYACVTTSE